MPWEHNDAWDDAIEASQDVIAVAGTRSANRRSTVFLRRPGQMICDSGVWNDPSDTGEEQLRGLLGGAGAEETRGAPRLDRDGERADVADRLGLTLLNVPDDEQLTLFREGRRLVPDALRSTTCWSRARSGSAATGCPRRSRRPRRRSRSRPPRRWATRRSRCSTPGSSTARRSPCCPNRTSNRPLPARPTPRWGTARWSPACSAGSPRPPMILVKRVLKMPLGEADELEVAAALGALPPDVDVVNASFGGPAADGTRMIGLQRALDELPQETLVVAAAGNEGMARRHYMAAFKGVVAVGSAAVQDGEPGVCFYSNRGRWVDVSTQGSDVETMRGPGDRVAANGTSFAVPKIVARILEIADEQGIGVRHAASWLTHQSGRPTIAGGGTFVDMPTP